MFASHTHLLPMRRNTLATLLLALVLMACAAGAFTDSARADDEIPTDRVATRNAYCVTDVTLSHIKGGGYYANWKIVCAGNAAASLINGAGRRNGTVFVLNYWNNPTYLTSISGSAYLGKCPQGRIQYQITWDGFYLDAYNNAYPLSGAANTGTPRVICV